ncbi:MAG: hypothetical protein H0W33_13600, partial [Gammaproteobacteria bacterium]|nr:hypothetical protein [Gammaproteobacteria bacterium]
VYAAGRDQVSDVWVAGRQLVANGRLTSLDEGELMRKAAAWGVRISAPPAAAPGASR